MEDKGLLEKEIEKTLVKRVKDLGGMCIKLLSPSMDGLPDRMVFLSDGKFAFVELKAKGKTPRPLQIKRMDDFKKLGYKCFVIDDKEKIGGVIDEIRST